jgi:hypothetical protein
MYIRVWLSVDVLGGGEGRQTPTLQRHHEAAGRINDILCKSPKEGIKSEKEFLQLVFLSDRAESAKNACEM